MCSPAGIDGLKPLVLEKMEKGDFGEDILRLAGALDLRQTAPLLLKTLNETIQAAESMEHEPDHVTETRIPLYAGDDTDRIDPEFPDPHLIVRTLGRFPKDRRGIDGLRHLLDQTLADQEDMPIPASLVAEIIRALGAIDIKGSAQTIYTCWTRKWPSANQAHLIRRAALDALTELDSAEIHRKILDQAERVFHDQPENRFLLREIVDYFGRVKFNESMTLLENIIQETNVSDYMLEACFQALSRLATPEGRNPAGQPDQKPVLACGPGRGQGARIHYPGARALGRTGKKETMTDQNNLKIAAIEARDLPDAWFQCVYAILDKGYEYTIDRGSYAGQKRLEFDYITIRIRHPGFRPLLPDIPPALGIPNPVADGYLEEYLPYLMTSAKNPGEEYTYGEFLEAQIEEVIRMYRQDGFETNQGLYDRGFAGNDHLSGPALPERH